MIRVATAADAAAVRDIYAPCVEATAITFETAVPDTAAMAERIAARLRTHPWIVLEENSAVLGYAYATRFRERAAYDWVVETSVYVHPQARRRGVAGRLYACLLDLLVLQGFTRAMGVITLPGAASVALHERFGFVPAGAWKEAGFKLGRWHDVGVWQRELAPAPAEPTPPPPFAAWAASPRLDACLRRHETG